jgi:SagB-type dehydrogenase family enzyme
MDEMYLRHEIPAQGGEADQEPLSYEVYHLNSNQYLSDVGYYRKIAYFNSSKLGLHLASRAAKSYACAERIPLPANGNGLSMTLTEAIGRRRSWRRFGGTALELSDLAVLLEHGNGITDRSEGSLTRRAMPSGGGLCPTELYVLPLDIPDLGYGAFHYDAMDHSLERFVSEPAEPMLGRACYTGPALMTASVALVISACFERQRVKYGERTYRFALLEAGHLAQNLLLVGTAMGLGTLPVGGFLDDEVNGYLRLDGRHEAVLYVILMGSLPSAVVKAGTAQATMTGASDSRLSLD